MDTTKDKLIRLLELRVFNADDLADEIDELYKQLQPGDAVDAPSATTSIEELIEIIKDKRKESDISNTLLRFCQTEAEKLLEREKKESISFGIWLSENASFRNEWLTVSESYELFKRQLNNLT